MRSCLVHLGHGTPPRTGSTARTQGFHHKQVPQTPSLVVAAESCLPKTVMRHTVKGCNNIHNNNNNTTNTAVVAVHRDAVGTMWLWMGPIPQGRRPTSSTSEGGKSWAFSTPRHWVLGFHANKITISVNRIQPWYYSSCRRVYSSRQLSSMVGKNPTFPGQDIGFWVLKGGGNFISANIIVFLFKLPLYVLWLVAIIEGTKKNPMFSSQCIRFLVLKQKKKKKYHLISVNKTVVLFRLLSYVFQAVVIIKGGKNLIFFGWCIGFWFQCKNKNNNNNKTWVPQIKPDFVGPKMIGFSKKKTMNNPIVKTRVVPALLQAPLWDEGPMHATVVLKK